MKNNYSIPSTFLESTSFFSKPTLFKSTSFSTTVSSFNKVEKKKSIDESSVNSSQMNYEKQLIVAMKRKTKLLNKHRRYNTNTTKCNLIEEIADVSIVLSQIVYLLKIDENMFKKYIANKIERTNKRYNNCGKFIGRNDSNE